MKQEPDPRGRCGNDAGMIWRHQRWDRIAGTTGSVTRRTRAPGSAMDARAYAEPGIARTARRSSSSIEPTLCAGTACRAFRVSRAVITEHRAETEAGLEIGVSRSAGSDCRRSARKGKLRSCGTVDSLDCSATSDAITPLQAARSCAADESWLQARRRREHQRRRLSTNRCQRYSEASRIGCEWRWFTPPPRRPRWDGIPLRVRVLVANRRRRT
jgi:hypothetical protein